MAFTGDWVPLSSAALRTVDSNLLNGPRAGPTAPHPPVVEQNHVASAEARGGVGD